MIKVGIGWDVHRLVPERKLVLGNVEIPAQKGCLGHSDGDALIHAVIDALLGAAGLDDIGTQFPDNDEQYRDVSSAVLLKWTCKLIEEQGFKVVNIDSNVILQEPKLSRYKVQMASRIAEILGIDSNCVCVKAKTAEKILGELGTGDAVVCQAVCLLEK